MDHPVFHCGRRLFEILLQGASRLQNHSPKSESNPEVLKIIRGIALIAIALVMGWSALTATERKTRTEVLQSEWPAPAILQSILEQRGWTRAPMSDHDTLVKGAPFIQYGSVGIWINEDRCAVFIQQSAGDSISDGRIPPALWTCGEGGRKKQNRQRWRKIGSGYDGVNQLAGIQAPKSKKPPSYIDPNEIRY